MSGTSGTQHQLGFQSEVASNPKLFTLKTTSLSAEKEGIGCITPMDVVATGRPVRLVALKVVEVSGAVGLVHVLLELLLPTPTLPTTIARFCASTFATNFTVQDYTNGKCWQIHNPKTSVRRVKIEVIVQHICHRCR